MEKDPNKQGVKISAQQTSELTKTETQDSGRHIPLQHNAETNRKGKKNPATAATPIDGTTETTGQSGLSLRICKLWDYISDMKKNNCFLFYKEYGVSFVKTVEHRYLIHLQILSVRLAVRIG